MNSIVDLNKPLFLSSISFLLPTKEYLVIAKSFCSKILESTRLIFFKKYFPHTMANETVKKEMACCFDVPNTPTNRVSAILKIMSKFVIC